MGIFEIAGTYTHMYGDDDIRTKLHEDHKLFRELTKQACEGTTSTSRANAFNKLKPLLTAHARAEEATVYMPMVKLRKSKEAKDHGNEGFVEHTLVDALVEHMSVTRPAGASDMWRARAQVRRELLDHHIDEEEREVFAELGENFDGEQRAAMAEKFEELKAEILDNRRPARKSPKSRGGVLTAST